MKISQGKKKQDWKARKKRKSGRFSLFSNFFQKNRRRQTKLEQPHSLKPGAVLLQLFRQTRRYRAQQLVSISLAIVLLLAFGFQMFVVAAPPETAFTTVSSDAEWNMGTLEDVTVNSGSIEISGDGGAGWLSGWQNRQPVTITNTGSAQTNYQVRVDVTYDAKMQADFDDLRFAKADGTELDFWLQSKVDSTSAVVWVEVDSLAGSGDTVIYMYYNNSGASSTSDGAATFPLFDDFNDASIDTGKWVEVDPSSKIDESAGSLRFLYGSGSGAWNASVYGVTSFTRADWSFEWDQTWISDYNPYDAFMFGWKDDGGAVSYTNLVYGYYNSGSGFCTTNCTGNVYEDGNSRGNAGVWDKDVTYNLRVRMRSAGGAYYEKSTNNGGSWTTDYTSTYSTEASLHPAWMHYAGDYLIDNVRVRKWMASEPSLVFGTEESALQSPGTYTSHNLDLQYIYQWGDCASGCNDSSTAFTTNITVPSNTSVQFELRHSADGSTNWSSWTSLATYTTSGTKTLTRGDLVGLIGDIFNRYVQTRITLTSSDGSSNPSIADYRYDYTRETDPPSNPNTQNGYASNGGAAITSGNWYNHPAPYFTWSGASDTDAGMSGGYSGYWVCFGTSSCEPTSGTFVSSAAYTAGSLTTNTTYYLRIKARDAAGNVATSAYDAFTYKYDATPPANPSGILPDPAGFTNVNDFDFTWNTGSDAGGSGIAEYCYKTGEDGYVETCTASTSVTGITAYQEGANIFYVRSKDIAGNLPTFYTQVSYYYSANAPSPPQGLEVDPTENTANSFTFTWLLPASYSNPIATYHYSVNALPTASNTTATTNLSVGPGAFATQQGTNIFYVVAKDTAGNVEWDSYAAVEFTANTTAPGIPTGVTLTDSSIRAQNKYSLTLTWDAPENEGSGIDHYVIDRSTTIGCSDGSGTWVQHATTTAEGYFDPNLSNTTTYCYRVKAADNAGAQSATSSIVSMRPEGRFTEPPELIGSPGVEAYIQSATVEWLTDREGSSFVEFGTSSDTLDRVMGQDDFVTSHSVTLLDLDPATTYYYRTKYTDQDSNTGYSSVLSFTTADAPSAPTNLSVDPESNTRNSFTFAWDPPSDAGVTIQGYFYSVNDVPTSTNTSFTAQQELGPGAYATRQGRTSSTLSLLMKEQCELRQLCCSRFHCHDPRSCHPHRPHHYRCLEPRN
ncbi:MAG: DUF2341 domain-containing protein [Candidatus Nomurabacteria bacterium]|nr:MAG: DUF2341 domain-containing protein [Candidatus Nomurabacteria bacterium]